MKLAEHLSLIEAMTYTTMLTEASRFEFLMKTYGAKMNAKWEAEGHAEPSDVQQAVSGQPGEDAASKLINLLMSFDPTPAKKNSNWLANIYCKGGLRLEDLSRVPDYIGRYEEMKKAKQIPAEFSNIERFKSINDLYDVIAQGQQQQAVAQNSEYSEMLKQCTVAYDGPDLLVLSPKTVDAAGYFGRDTEWCTTYGCPGTRYPHRGDNRFNYYTKDGPLWIIIDKEHNTKFQFHFESGQFMDPSDRPITYNKFFEQYPKVLQIIGEDKFLKYIDRIGIAPFSDDAIAQIASGDPTKLARLIITEQDFQRLPESARTPELIDELFRLGSIKLVPAKYYKNDLDALLSKHPKQIVNIPKRYLTAERVVQAFDNFNYFHYDVAKIPEEFRTDEMNRVYWKAMAVGQYKKTHLSDVPEKYWSPSIIVACLKRFLDDVPHFLRVITPEIARGIAYQNIPGMIAIPAKFLTSEEGDWIVDQMKNYYSSSTTDWHTERLNVLKRIPTSAWDLKIAEFFVKKLDLPYAKLPEPFRDNTDLIKTMVMRRSGKDIAHIDAQYLTPEIVTEALKNDYNCEHLKQFLKYHPDLINDTTLVPAIRSSYWLEELLKAIPKDKMSDAVMSAFAEKNALPLKRLPKHLITPELIVSHAAHNSSEMLDVPENMWTQELAEKVVQASDSAAAFMPKHVLTEPVLFAFLRTHAPHGALDGADETSSFNYRYNYHKNDGEKDKRLKLSLDAFPKRALSARNYALAVEIGLLKATISSIPKGAMSTQAAVAFLIKDPKLIKKLPENLAHDPAVLAKAVERRIDVMDVLTPEQITEPVAHAAIANYAHHIERYGENHGQRTYQKQFDRIPKTLWSERVWTAAAGHLVTLKDVPEKFVTPELVKNAITREPKNLRDLPDPAKYLNEHNIEAPANKDELAKWEDNGVVFNKKKGAVNVRDLPRDEIPGGSITTAKVGASNKRVYIFDSKGTLVARLFSKTEKGTDKVIMPTPKNEAMTHDDLIFEAVKAAFPSGFDLTSLNQIGIFGDHYKKPYREGDVEKTQVGDLFWTKTPFNEGERHRGYLKDGTLIVTIETGITQGGWGRRGGSSTLNGVEADNFQECIAHSQDIIAYFKEKRLPTNPYYLKRIGIAESAGELVSMVQKKIAGRGKLQIWSGGKFLCAIIGDKIAATATRFKNGTISKVDLDYDFDKLRDKVTEAMTAAASIGAESGADVPVQKQRKPRTAAMTPEKIEELRTELRRLCLEYRPNWPEEDPDFQSKLDGLNIDGIKKNLKNVRERLENRAAQQGQ